MAMEKIELLERLETLKDEQGAKACLGCRYLDDKCLDEGCAIIKEAIERIKKAYEGEKRRGNDGESNEM